MDPADLDEIGSRLPENVRALERRKMRPKFALLTLLPEMFRFQRGLERCARSVERVDNPDVLTVRTAEEYERLTGRKWVF